MATWWKVSRSPQSPNDPGYVNVDMLISLFVTSQSSPAGWVICGVVDDSGGTATLNGVYATEAEALTALGKLVRGFDPGAL